MSGMKDRKHAMKVGTMMPDGTIYVGVSPDSGRPFFTQPSDTPLYSTFRYAKTYVGRLYVHGRKDWRVPTKAELNVLFQNRVAIGGFDNSGMNPAKWYWSSSTRFLRWSWLQRFTDGQQHLGGPVYAALRCVRG